MLELKCRTNLLSKEGKEGQEGEMKRVEGWREAKRAGCL